MRSSKNVAPVLIGLLIIGYVLNLFFNRYLTHHLNPDVYGDLCIGLNVLEIAATTILLGTEISSVRFIPLLEQAKRAEAFMSWNVRFIAKALVLFMMLISGIAISVWIYEAFFEHWHTALYLLFVAPFSAVYALLLSYFNAQDDIVFSTAFDAIGRSGTIWVAFGLVFSGLSLMPKSSTIAIVYGITFFILTLIAWVAYNHRHVPIKILRALKATYDEHREWKSASLNYAFANAVFLLFMYVDKMILEMVHTSEDVIGHYAVLVLLVGLFTLVTRASAAVLSPHISTLMSSKQSSETFQKLLDKTNATSLFFFVALLSVYLFFGKELLSHFGKNNEYTAIYGALMYLSVSQIFLEIGKSALRMLLYRGFTSYINTVFVICLIILVVLGSYLTYHFGLNGIIAAHIMTSFLYMMAYVWKVKKEFKEIKVLSIY